MSVRPGNRYGRLVVVALQPKAKAACRCDCGVVVSVFRNNLTRGNSQSCGCLRREMLASGQINRRHGHARRRQISPEYRSYTMMLNRCLNPSAENYEYYGGRGIAVCQRWQDSFEAFLSDMGQRPSRNHSIDRIRADGDYEPGNCRWATKIEQCQTRRRRRWWRKPVPMAVSESPKGL